jgi:hypothetical protein
MFNFDSVFDNILEAVGSIGYGISDATDYITEKGAKTWNSVTGKAKFEEAEKILTRIDKKYNQELENYKKEIEEISSKIENKISSINFHKQNIYENYFEIFTLLVNKLHNLSIQGTSFLDYFDENLLEIKTLSGIRHKSDLYKIDFNNLRFKEVTFGLATLGFYTRKKATETLYAVKEEEQRINEEIEKMNAQIKKSKVIFNSIDNVEQYFSSIIHIYSKLLSRFEYGIKSQTQKQLLHGKLLDGKINFRLMPLVHIEEFQTLFNLSIVLKTMSTMGYLNDNFELEKDDIKTFTNIQSLVTDSIPEQFAMAA